MPCQSLFLQAKAVVFDQTDPDDGTHTILMHALVIYIVDKCN